MKYPVIRWSRLAINASETNDFLTIGPVPNEEECTPCGTDWDAGILECQVYADQLIREYGPLPQGCDLVIIENVHDDFGIYHEVGVRFTLNEEEMTDAEEHAQKLESGCEIWDAIARQQLIEAEHPLYVAKVIQMKKSA